jgi:hypothetical protein
MIVNVGCVLQGVMSEGFVEECALRVLFKGRGEHGRGDDSCGEVQRRGDGEHVAETNAQVDP